MAFANPFAWFLINTLLMEKGIGTKLRIKNMILSTFGKIALNFHGYSSFCFDILKKLFFKKSIFLGTEVEDMASSLF